MIIVKLETPEDFAQAERMGLLNSLGMANPTSHVQIPTPLPAHPKSTLGNVKPWQISHAVRNATTAKRRYLVAQYKQAGLTVAEIARAEMLGKFWAYSTIFRDYHAV